VADAWLNVLLNFPLHLSKKMQFSDAMMHDTVWFDRPKYEEAREHYQMFLTNNLSLQVSKPHEEQGLFERATTAVAQAASSASSALISEIAEIRDTIKQSLSGVATQVHHAVTAESGENNSQVKSDNSGLIGLIEKLSAQVAALDVRVSALEGKGVTESKPAPATATPAKKDDDDDDDDDDVDLFGDDSESETEEEKAAAEKKKQALIAKYNEKKSKKPALIPKSSIVLDVKPWDDETDMAKVEEAVRSIELDGLVWGASKLVPLAYGIKKLSIMCVVEDDKVGTDILDEMITEFDDLVQSVDIAAFNKI